MKNRNGSVAYWVIAAVLIVLICTIMFFNYRGSLVMVPTGHVGKIKTSAGFTGPVKYPAMFRLPSNWFGANPTKLVLAEVSDHRVQENIPALYMPKDNLNLEFEVIGTFSVSTNEAKINGLYDRLTPVESSQGYYVQVIPFKQVYGAYAQQALRTIAMEVVANYTIQHVLENLEAVSIEIQKKVNERLAPTPISVRYCGLGAVNPPELIVTAQERAKEREIQIATANAQKLVSLVKADADYQVGLKQQQIDLLEAETQVLADLVISDAVSEAYIAQRSLRVLENLAKNAQATFLISSNTFSDPASLLGLSTKTTQELRETSEEREQKLRHALELIEEAKRDAQARMDAEKSSKQD